jgi:hypothetical protein
MNHPCVICGTVLLTILCSCTRLPENQSHQRTAFAARIESILPPNWALEETGQEVVIGRKEPVTSYPCVSMDVRAVRDGETLKQYVNRNGESQTYKIRLRRAALVDVSEYRRQQVINKQIVVTKQTAMPNRKFLEDDAMRSYDSRYRELPEYYDDASSIYLETNLGPYECVYPNPVAEECEGIRQKLDSLFNRYSSDNYRRTLGRYID